MLIEGSHVLAAAPREAVFAALSDPAVLARSLPGCRELVEAGDGAYDMTMETGVGSIRGTYAGRVSIDEQVAPERYAATLDAGGPTGSVRARLTASLLASGAGTEVGYRVDADLTGAIAGVGQRVAAGVARRNAALFFEALERELSPAPAAAEEAAAPPAPRSYAGAAAAPAPADARWLGRGIALGFLTTAGGVLLGMWAQRRRRR